MGDTALAVTDMTVGGKSAEDQESTLAGRETIGHYRVLGRLGAGAMGTVFEAYDTELERKVAIKMVRLSGGVQASMLSGRLLREAKALAKIEHPHIVRVYEVGSHRGELFVVMEMVRGRSLRAVLDGGEGSWRWRLEVMLQAGHALQAAHAVGIVHRDFKPDNVLVDEAGRARVVDFGLALERGSSAQDSATATVSALPESAVVELTRDGELLGTPAYMSPEQHFGQPAGPASDQFSYCVTLYEVMYGLRPFAGDSWSAIRTAIVEGRLRPPPVSRVPRRIFRLLGRGLEMAPEERWPSMDALIEALERDPWRTRTRVAAIVGLVAAASSTSYALAISRSEDGACELSPALLAGVWDAARGAEVSRAFTATNTPIAADTWTRVHTRLDAYAEAWRGEWQAACEARRQGLQTGRLADLREACLGRRRSRLAALVNVFAVADRAVVENAVQAVAALPSVATCNSEEAFELAVAPIEDPALASKVEGLREQLSRAEALEGTGKYDEGVRLTGAIRVEAAAAGHMPLVAEAALLDGRMLMHLGRSEESAAALLEAVRLGVTQDHHVVAAEAAATRVYVLGELLGRRAEALATEGYADALVQRARDDGKLVALLFNNLAVVHQNDHSFEAASAYYERAIEVLRKRPGHPDFLTAIIYNNLGNMAIEQGDMPTAKKRHEQAVELFGKLLGDSHPLVSHPLSSLGDVGLRQGDAAGAGAYYLRSLAIMEVAYGPEHPYLMHVLPGLGRAELLMGQAEVARRHFARAVAIAEAQGLRTVQLAQALEGLADVAAAGGEKEAARGLYVRAAEVFEESVGKEDARGARAALRAGELAAELGDREAAKKWFERVLAKRPGEGGKDPAVGAAALALAVALSAEPGAAIRACALAGQAAAGLPAEHARRAEVDALAARVCPKG